MNRIFCCCCKRQEPDDVAQGVEVAVPSTSDNVVYRRRDSALRMSNQFTNPIALPGISDSAVATLSTNPEYRQSVSFRKEERIEEGVSNSGYITTKDLTSQQTFETVSIKITE